MSKKLYKVNKFFKKRKLNFVDRKKIVHITIVTCSIDVSWQISWLNNVETNIIMPIINFMFGLTIANSQVFNNNFSF